MISVENLTKVYAHAGGRSIRALDGISLTIGSGGFVMLVGANGSGKSTLLGSIAGTVIPDSGKISIGGREVTRLPVHSRAGFIGRVFQDPSSGTASDMTVSENLRLAATRGVRRGLKRGLGRAELGRFHQRLAELQMDLENRLFTPVGHLSGGQRQALSMLMAVWRRPEVLLLDEHTASLDPRSEEKILGLTEKLVASHQLTTLAVTHRIDLALRLGHRTLVMRHGGIIGDFEGKDRQAMTSASLAAVMDSRSRSDIVNGK